MRSVTTTAHRTKMKPSLLPLSRPLFHPRDGGVFLFLAAAAFAPFAMSPTGLAAAAAAQNHLQARSSTPASGPAAMAMAEGGENRTKDHSGGDGIHFSATDAGGRTIREIAFRIAEWMREGAAMEGGDVNDDGLARARGGDGIGGKIMLQSSCHADFDRITDGRETEGGRRGGNMRGRRSVQRPFVTLAYAQTLDGMIAAAAASDSDGGGDGGKSPSTTSNLRISGPESSLLTHRLRAMHDAVLVGASTFAVDNPQLNVRLSRGDCDTVFGAEETAPKRQPIPVVLDTNLASVRGVTGWSGGDGQVVRARGAVICCGPEAFRAYLKERGDFVDDRRKCGDEGGGGTSTPFSLLPCRVDSRSGSLDLRDVLHRLRDVHGIRSVMVEGGAKVLSSFLESPRDGHGDGGSGCDRSEGGSEILVDCVCATVSPTLLGGRQGLHAFRDLRPTGEACDGAPLEPQLLRLGNASFYPLGGDCILIGRVQ